MAEKIYGLLGRRLGHSWSVPVHTALGCGGYRLIEVEPEELKAFLEKPEIGGLNVTIPYKREVMACCDVIDETARSIGSVNTLVRRPDGKLYAWNTDAEGFQWMAERAGVRFAGKKVVIFGSGGASLTVQAVAKAQGAREVAVVSRSGADNYGNLDRHRDGEILVNTTPVGMYPHNGASLVDLACFPRCEGLLDLIYNPRRTALLARAEELGIPCSDGLPMLVAQARAAEERFFERSIPDSENRRVLAQLYRDTRNIVLIGMPGCGKSAVGRELAALTGREAIDIDRRVEERAGRSIPELFAREGEGAFRELEREETAKAGKLSGRILVTGGGVVKDARNYAALRQNGRIYHLLRELSLLPAEGRPVSQAAGPERLWEERAPMYARFRDVLIENNGSVQETAQAVWRDFCENSGA